MKGNWAIKKLESLVIKKGEYGINAASCEYSPNLYTYLRITDISEDGRFIKEGKKSVDHPESEKFVLEEGDIVFARTGASTGKTYLYNKSDGVLVFAGFLIRFKPNSDLLDSLFLKYVTQTSYYKNWVSIYSARTGQPGINGNEYGKFSFKLPPLPQQKKIAKILSTCDAVIEKTEAAIAKYQDIKQGMMHDLFTRGIDLTTGKLRPTSEEAPELYKDSELGKIPKDWEVDILCNALKPGKNITYGIVQPGEYVSSGVYMIRSQDYTKGWNGIETIMQVHPSIDKPYERSRVYSGDLLITVVGANVGRMEIVPESLNKANISRSVSRISINPEYANNKFCFYYLKSQMGKILFSNQVGGAQPVINLKSLEKFNFKLPNNRKEQLEIAKRINSIENKIQGEIKTLNKSIEIKSGLMQDLLTGKVEVNV
ncbi:restriction endonuclease subunit S [Flammeovirga sp. OC4]|uniref:restriction endonuclease subunit S n=1 Tax=Flammeovirga sp. OC4 TaxID=1382345 RepID=UPI0006942133|nr:restriction endonuclease subunit S [Flammeovirga sp. OC4]